MATTLCEQVSVKNIRPDEFQTHYNPNRMGNLANIAYGGCALGVGIQAACRTVSPPYLLYSAFGSFLAPVSTEHKLECFVQRLRDTRTFATRQVEVKQKQKNGTIRLCMILLADFHKKEESSLLRYSAPPERSYSPPESCLSPLEASKEMARRSIIPQESVALYSTQFGLMARFFETRQAPEGIVAHNLNGIAKERRTDQDQLPLSSKTSADWFRSRCHVQEWQDQYAGLAFMMDAYLASLPLVHSAMFLDDAAACSSLEFALRIFVDDLDLNSWNLRELRTISGNIGRTYTEARLWDSSGNLVASMTQQSILRPKQAYKPSL